MKINRRSFLVGGLKGAALSAATFTFGTIVNPMSMLSAKEPVGEQIAALNGIKKSEGMIKVVPANVKAVPTSVAEKAFLLGFARVGHEYADKLQFIDVEAVGNGFAFSGVVGKYPEACHIGFSTSDLMTVDFAYMNSITQKVYDSVHTFFGRMTYAERLAANGMAAKPSIEDMYD